MNSFLIQSNRIYGEDGCFQGAMLIEDGIIKQCFTKNERLPSNIEILYVEDAYVLPGIIDIHSHGYRTWSAKTIDKNEIKGLSRILPSIGVCATLPTTTAWKEEEDAMLEAIAIAMEEGCVGTTILGIHMEGPFFHPNRHNATSRHEIQPPTLTKAKQYWNSSRHCIRYMTLAPEMPKADEVIKYFQAFDVVIGAGHTNATSEQFCEGVVAGVRSSIHTGNAMRQIHHREIGVMGEALLQKDMYCEIICDFYHLSKEMLEIMFRIKQDDSKFIMISDSDLLSGVEAGKYLAFGKSVHVHTDGRVLLEDGTISGSSKHVLYGIQNLVLKMNMALERVIPLFSLNPATLLSIQDKKGSLCVGKDADIMILDSNLEVLYTFVEGRLCYKKGDHVLINPEFSNNCKRMDVS